VPAAVYAAISSICLIYPKGTGLIIMGSDKRSAEVSREILLGQVEEIKSDPEKLISAINKATEDGIKQTTPVYFTDPKFYYGVLIILGGTIFISAIGTWTLVYLGIKEIPETFIALGTTALGIFAGIFAAKSIKDD